MSPYTYLITDLTNGKRYYGVRHCKGCDPSELGISYLSSSLVVKAEIKKKGIENFKFEVRQKFETKEQALLWEEKFLTRIDAANRDDWYNRHNGGVTFRNDGHSEETKRKIALKAQGRVRSMESRMNQSLAMRGKPKSKEHIEKVANAHRGMKRSLETRQKISAARRGQSLKRKETHASTL